eukprot:COSAG06_NODE_16045_length_1026_cov_1.372168_2_plen_194_part_00
MLRLSLCLCLSLSLGLGLGLGMMLLLLLLRDCLCLSMSSQRVHSQRCGLRSHTFEQINRTYLRLGLCLRLRLRLRLSLRLGLRLCLCLCLCLGLGLCLSGSVHPWPPAGRAHGDCQERAVNHMKAMCPIHTPVHVRARPPSTLSCSRPYVVRLGSGPADVAALERGGSSSLSAVRLTNTGRHLFLRAHKGQFQ